MDRPLDAALTMPDRGALDVDDALRMHRFGDASEQAAARIFDYVAARRRTTPPLDRPRSLEELAATTGPTITDSGLGFDAALAVFADVLAPACISSNHPRYLAFVPTAPTEAATFFDLVVSATNVYGDWWLEGAGAIYAEMQALRWLADLAGFPGDAGGVFVSGATAANLAALVVARETWRDRRGRDGRRLGVAVCSSAHSSVRLVAKVTDLAIVAVPAGERERLTGVELRRALDACTDVDVCAVVATAGATNTGVIDDLPGIAEVCADRGVWMHVDAAYGGAALASTRARPWFRGIDRADSFVVDPHKWLFAPFDCAALLYRDPELARAALTQHAGYLETLEPTSALNPSDLAVHMTRRARGLPLWFSLATHGTAAYDRAVTRGLDLAQEAARLIDDASHLELVMRPELSVVLFRRRGWSADDYQRWSDEALEQELGFVVPTVHDGETVFRFCFVNPTTTVADIEAILVAMKDR